MLQSLNGINIIIVAQSNKDIFISLMQGSILALANLLNAG